MPRLVDAYPPFTLSDPQARDAPSRTSRARKILRAQHAEARRAKFDCWGAAQQKRLRRFGERIRLALTRGGGVPRRRRDHGELRDRWLKIRRSPRRGWFADLRCYGVRHPRNGGSQFHGAAACAPVKDKRINANAICETVETPAYLRCSTGAEIPRGQRHFRQVTTCLAKQGPDWLYTRGGIGASRASLRFPPSRRPRTYPRERGRHVFLRHW